MRLHAAQRFAGAIFLAAMLLGGARSTHAAPTKPDKRVVVLVGLPGAGKSTLALPLSRELGNAPRHRCSKVLRKWIKDQGLPLNKETDVLASQTFARTPGRLMTELSKTIARSRKPVHIVDGVRSKADLKVLQEQFGAANVKVLALTLPKDVRYGRLANRARYGETEAAAFLKRDQREIGLGVLHVLRRPFARVDMSGPKSAVPGVAAQLARQLEASWK